MFDTIVLPPSRRLQSIRENGTLAYKIPIFDLDPTDKNADSGHHGQRSSYWHKRVARILVMQRKLNPRARWFEEPLINEAETDHTAIWAKGIRGFGKKTHFPGFQDIICTRTKILAVRLPRD